MLGIMKKNSTYYLIVILILAYPTFYEFLEGVNNPLAFSKFLGMLMYFACIVPPMMNETQEEKFKGYNFLATLPVTVRETVTAKFTLMLIAVLFVTVWNSILLIATGSPARMVIEGINLLAWNAAVCLVLGGLMFLLVFRFGAVHAMMGILSVTLGLNLLTFFAFKSGKDLIGKVISWSSFAQDLHPAFIAVVMAAGIGAHLLLTTVAIRIKENRRIS